MKMTKQSAKPELKLPATPKALRNKAGKTKNAPPVKAAKAKKPQGITWTSNAKVNEVNAAELYAARGTDLVPGDGIKSGTILRLKCGYGIAVKPLPSTGLGRAVAVKFQANGQSRSAADGKVYPVMRLPGGHYIIVQRPGGKLTWGAERQKEREATRFAKVK